MHCERGGAGPQGRLSADCGRTATRRGKVLDIIVLGIGDATLRADGRVCKAYRGTTTKVRVNAILVPSSRTRPILPRYFALRAWKAKPSGSRGAVSKAALFPAGAAVSSSRPMCSGSRCPHQGRLVVHKLCSTRLRFSGSAPRACSEELEMSAHTLCSSIPRPWIGWRSLQLVSATFNPVTVFSLMSTLCRSPPDGI